MNNTNVVIGAPVYRQGAYVLDRFLRNQKQIQLSYPSSQLVFATDEYDYVKELEDLIHSWDLNGIVLTYDVVRPDYAQSSIWNIANGREAIRRYAMSHPEVQYLLFLDTDMTFEPSVIPLLQKEIQGFGAVFSGYPLRNYGIGLAGAGCVMLTRDAFEKIEFRCYEFKNGEVIFEDNVLEMDLFRTGRRIKKGFFLSIDHYLRADIVLHIARRPVGLVQKLTNCAFLRFLLIRISIMVGYNIPWKLKIFFNRGADSD
jgi:hypothetical protein